jgi:transposase
LRTRRFAEEELQRTKTDAIDALGIARFAAQKRPPAALLPDVATEELGELARLRERLVEDFAGRLRQLHRAVDLGFPEFTRYARTLESQLATTILSRYPTAASFHSASVKKLARIIYDGSHKVGEELACTLIEAAEKYVGGHASPTVRSARGSDASIRSRPGSMTNQIVMRTALGPRNMIVSRHSMVC